MSYVVSATEAIVPYLKKGNVIVVDNDIFKRLLLTEIGRVIGNKNLFVTRKFLDKYKVIQKRFKYELLGKITNWKLR